MTGLLILIILLAAVAVVQGIRAEVYKKWWEMERSLSERKENSIRYLLRKIEAMTNERL